MIDIVIRLQCNNGDQPSAGWPVANIGRIKRGPRLGGLVRWGSTHKNINIIASNIIFKLELLGEVKGPSGSRLPVGVPSGLLTSSFAPFGRSGRVNQLGAGGTLSVTEQ